MSIGNDFVETDGLQVSVPKWLSPTFWVYKGTVRWDPLWVGRWWVEDRCPIFTQPKIFSTATMGDLQGALNIHLQDMGEHQRNVILRSILIPHFASCRSLNLRKGNKMFCRTSLRICTVLYLFLIANCCVFRELLCPHHDEENGPYSGVHLVLTPFFVLSEHLVCHFGTRETPSRYQRTILGYRYLVN